VCVMRQSSFCVLCLFEYSTCLCSSNFCPFFFGVYFLFFFYFFSSASSVHHLFFPPSSSSLYQRHRCLRAGAMLPPNALQSLILSLRRQIPQCERRGPFFSSLTLFNLCSHHCIFFHSVDASEPLNPQTLAYHSQMYVAPHVTI